MNINEANLNKMKSRLTEKDIEEFRFCCEKITEINNYFSDAGKIMNFIMIYSTTFIDGSSMTLDEFILTLRRGHAASEKIRKLKIKNTGH